MEGGLEFLKMHGLGNDFVVVDARRDAAPLSAEAVRAIADRHRGVGCDQVIRMEPSEAGDVFMRIWNPDGSEAEACGNATRCVARLVMDETGGDRATVETVAGLLPCETTKTGRVAADMGVPRTGWDEIPLARETDALALDVGQPALGAATAVNMGNPHAVLFVDDAEAVDLAAVGPAVEHHPLFPARTNVGVASVTGEQRFRLRVWERGAGITLACGSAACAAAVAACLNGLAQRDRPIEIAMDGGPLKLLWRGDGHVVMTGPTTLAYRGTLAPHLLNGGA